MRYILPHKFLQDHDLKLYIHAMQNNRGAFLTPSKNQHSLQYKFPLPSPTFLYNY